MYLGQNRMGFHSKKLIVKTLPRIGLLPLGDKLDSALAMVVESQANLIIKAKFNIFATDARSVPRMPDRQRTPSPCPCSATRTSASNE